MTDRSIISLSKEDFMRSKILESIKKLLVSVPFRKITVTDICDCAGISRSSFYHLFSDIQDAVSWEFSRLMDIVLEKYPSSEDWRANNIKQIADFMGSVMADATFFRRVANDMSRVDYNSVFFRVRRKCAKSFFYEPLALWQGRPADYRCAFEIEFFMMGTSDYIGDWMVTMRGKPEEIAESLIACVPQYLGEVMDRSFEEFKQRQNTE